VSLNVLPYVDVAVSAIDLVSQRQMSASG